MPPYNLIKYSWVVLILCYINMTAAQTCDLNGQTLLTADVVQPRGIITLDTYGFTGDMGWDSATSGGLLTLLDDGTQKIHLNGSAGRCVVYKGLFAMQISYWLGSENWLDGSTTPGYFMGADTADSACTLMFDPPIYQISMWTNSKPTQGQLSIYQDTGAMVSCTAIDAIGGANPYSIRGFSSTAPFTYVTISTAIMTGDNIMWSPCQFDYALYNGQCELISNIPIDPPVEPPVTAPIGAPIDAPVTAPVATPITTPIAAPVASPTAATPVKAPTGKTSFATTSVSVSSAISVVSLVLALAW